MLILYVVYLTLLFLGDRSVLYVGVVQSIPPIAVVSVYAISVALVHMIKVSLKLESTSKYVAIIALVSFIFAVAGIGYVLGRGMALRDNDRDTMGIHTELHIIETENAG